MLWIVLFQIMVLFVSGRLLHSPFLSKMSDERLRIMASQPSNMSGWLKPLLRERVSGTLGNLEVRKFLVNELKKAGFSVSDEPFKKNTPKGPVTFANVLGLSGAGHRRLILTAHYDSKDIPKFIGAIDSAAPCAILLDVVHSLSSKLEKNPSDRSLQIIFFDGEEAFLDWTAEDSLYGSRHLAEKWEQTFVTMDTGMNGTVLSMIDLFVLLDLLGSKGSLMYNTHPKTVSFF
jgi:glutaminyl-peptide cyclotransferase